MKKLRGIFIWCNWHDYSNLNFNHAIIIRSIFQKTKCYIFRQAGVVAKSNPKNELQEVYNKIGAIIKTLED